MEKTFVSVAVQTDPCEFDLSEVRAVTLGRPWPSEHEDTSHIEQGYYRRDDGTLGKVKNGVKLTDSEDDHSSSHSAKRARYDADDADGVDDADDAADADASSSQESMLGCGDDGSPCGEHSISAVETFGDDQATDDAEVSQYELYRCNNTFIEDGEEIRCVEQTNGSSQLCHYCMQSFKRSMFA